MGTKKIQIISKKGKVIKFPALGNVAQYGNVLKEARIRNNLSQGGIADFMVINWEQNKSKPDCSVIPKLCSFLGVTLNELFGVKDEYTQTERTLVSNFRLLKPTTQRVAFSLIDSMVTKELAAHDEMLVNTTRIIDEQPGALAAGTAASGIEIPSVQPTPYFITINDRTKKADAVVRVSGHSMEPEYHPNDMVFFEYTNSASVGEDVVVCWAGQAFIKRLGDDGTLFSLNPDYPFEYEGDGSDIQILGRVLGVLGVDDKPAESDMDALYELFHDELAQYDREHGEEY